MGLGHVPQEPVRAEGEGADVQGRQRRGAAAQRPVDLSRAARGRWGEDRAADWYRAQGYVVVDRNWRCDAGEIDLVATRGELVVVVEVKARRTDRYGPGSLAVDATKQRRLRTLALRWLDAHRGEAGDGWRPLRFDVVTVTGTAVEVIEAAF